MKRLAQLVAVFLLAVPVAPAALAQRGEPVDLISREVLFGNPDRAGVQVSPDGSKISYLAPRDGVLNVWVAPVDDLAAAQPVTNDRERGVRTYFWTYLPDHLVYLQDRGGDEDWQVFVTNVATGETRNMTPFDHIPHPQTGEPMVDPATGKKLRPTAQIQGVSRFHPETILIGLNMRDPRFHDIYRLNLKNGNLDLIQKNEGYAGFVTDEDYRVRLAARPTPTGGMDYLKRAEGEDGEAAWAPFISVAMADSLTTSPLGFDRSGDTIYMRDSRGRDTAAITAVEIDTEDTDVLATHPKADMGQVLIHPTERHIQAASANYLRAEWQILDGAIEDDFAYLRTVADGDFNVVNRTLDDRTWVVVYVMDDGPVRYYLYDRDAREAEFLFTNRPALEDAPLAAMHPVVIEARDGMDLVSYYTLPTWTDSDGDGRPERPLAMVLVVHGGPWARDSWGYNAMHQWLANRGYAVLSVNFRGSTGFGKSFINAGNLEWGEAMHDDLIDAVDWAIAEGIADEDRVAIMGGSYGGYATLVGLTFTPAKFAAGVDIVGPSNLISLLESIPPYWASFRDQFRKRVGDIDTPEGRRLLRARSPLTHVDEIKRPLLIGQGANDPRVKEAESQQIVDAMVDRDIPVTYVLYPDEGHGFARPENRLSFFAVAEAFLSQHLGGVYEEIGDDFDGSSITAPVGAEQIPGVSDALGSAD